MQNGNDGDVQRVEQAERALHCQVLSNGPVATLVFRLQPSERFPNGEVAIQLPTNGLRHLRAAIHAAHVFAYGYAPLSVEVGHPNEIRNTVSLTIDKDTDAPLMFFLRDDLASKVAAWITQDQIERLSAAERAKLSTAIIEPVRGIIMPRRDHGSNS